ncbi:Inositol 2-dehydrogenase/D-chiro-inositol 3-dehydrogenase [Baekduia alba]|uniref:Gfo/Idh/MocA family protein n=1 Tax=Baekduia alba TaxID=2997333 RepID=UPI002341B04E|nr:Gfo/Idh/MocA family oxidoreductase [Baekduia alba]WCB95046.1 Inositol 2-dehydrogenase/D-chiro-inositol 3-dehydrogenase [Baekduia alba]
MRTRKELRVGIAGAGFIGAVHARSARLAGGRLVGVAASSPESARRAADRLDVPKAYMSADELVADPELDVVHICTPNHLHGPLALAALAGGKHVVCEKPLATATQDAEALADAARAADRVAAVPFVYRYYPTVREARARVADGGLGAVHLVHGTYLQDWLLSSEDHNWRVDPALGGASRAFADIGSHWCDLAEFVTGQRIARLSARTHTAVPERRDGPARAAFAVADGNGGALHAVATEDVALVQFETDGGAMGSLVVSQVSAGRKNALRLEVDAAGGALAFDQEDPETLWWGRREAATLLRRDPGTLSPPAARLAVLPAGHPQGYADCFDLFVADVYAAIRDGVDPDGLPRFADGVRAARLTDAVMASAAQHAWVDVPTPVEVPR